MREGGQLSLTHAPVTTVSYSVLLRQGVGPSFLSTSAGKGQDKIPLVWQLVRGGINFVQSYPLGLWWYRSLKTDHGCIRALNLDMSPGSSSEPDITMALGGNQVTYVSLFLTAFSSTDMPLSI